MKPSLMREYILIVLLVAVLVVLVGQTVACS